MSRRTWWWVAVVAGLGCLAIGVSQLPWANAEMAKASAFAPPHRPAPPLVFTPELPPDKPDEARTLGEASQKEIGIRVAALARAMAEIWTRNPENLVVVIDDAARSTPSAPSVTLLLAIAYAETGGKILDVSEAGAVGLAQATPIAYLEESFHGKLFVTEDYLIGARAYILKKPLDDADTIASLIVANDTPAARKEAKRLLASAKRLRREGIDEVDVLAPFASERFYIDLDAMDAHNRIVLNRLGRLLDHGSRASIRSLRDQTRREYRRLRSIQVAAWKRYQKDLIAKRDRMLEEHFGMPSGKVKKTLAYEASEYLGENLDDRFSAKSMSRFLVYHLDRQSEEARKLAKSQDDVERLTAALYNAGSHNVKRMLAGLIRSLPETEKYMKKVPATRRRLDNVIGGVPVGKR